MSHNELQNDYYNMQFVQIIFKNWIKLSKINSIVVEITYFVTVFVDH